MNKDMIKSLKIYVCTVIFTVLFPSYLYGITVDNNGFRYNLCKHLFSSNKHSNNVFLEPITTDFNPYDYVGEDLSERLNYAISVLVYDYKKQLEEILKIKLKDARFVNTIKAMERAKVKIYNLRQILELFEGIDVNISISDENQRLLEDLSKFEKESFADRIRRIYKKSSTDQLLTRQDHLLLERYYDNLASNTSNSIDFKQEQIMKELSNTKKKLEQFLILSQQNIRKKHDLILRTPNDLDDIDQMYPVLNLKSKIQSDSINPAHIELSSTELSYILFFSEHEYLRKKVFTMLSNSSIHDIQYDFITGTIFKLSHEYSKLNGYSNYSDFVLHNTTTRFNDINEVYDMLKISLKRINKKIKNSRNSLAKKILSTEPYNYLYTLNKMKKDINSSSQIFNYLEINSVIHGVTEVFEKIFGVRFLERFHSDSEAVRIYDILDIATNTIISTIYINLSNHSNENTSLTEHGFQQRPSLKIIRPKTKEFYPIFQLNLNITKYKNPITNLDTIIFNDIFSLFHELGHCFYFILIEPSYFILKDNFDNKDFIEYPAIFMEQLARNKDIAKIYLKDYYTKEPIDDRLLSRILDIKDIEYFTSRIFQLMVSYVDIKSYSTNFDSMKAFSLKTEEFLNRLSKQIQIFDTFPQVLRDQPYVRFNTMFSEFYAAKCYIYTLAYNLTEYSIEKDIQAHKINVLDFNMREYLKNIYTDPNTFIFKVLREY